MLPPLNWTVMVSAEDLNSGVLHLQSTTVLLRSRGSQEESNFLSYSLEVILLFGQPETAEVASVVPLTKPGSGKSLTDFKRSV